MKRILIFLQLFIIIGLYSNSLFAQTYFEARVIENEKGYLEYQVRSVDASVTPTTAIPITQISFEIRWPNTSSADVEVLCSNNYYTIVDGLAAKQTKDSYFWRNFVKGQANPVYSDHDWTTNEWETIVEFKVTGTSGTTDFEVAPKDWVAQNLVWAQGAPTATTYFPVVNGSVSNYSYPTLVYDFVWTGANTFHGAPSDSKVWDVAGNWNDECEQAAGDYPWQGTENVYIPDVSAASGFFPEESGGLYHDGWICNNMLIGSGAHVTVPDLSSAVNTYLDVQGNLIVKGKLYLPALGYATITGNTDIENSEGVEVQADANGVGSFIDNGTITYGTNGTAKVQTYLANSAGNGSFYMHLVGPTVDEQSYTGSGTGAFLSAFNVSGGSTYAYSWDETQPVATGWQNQSSNTYEVHTADGIALSTIDATNYTLNMTGELITGPVSSPALTYSNNHYEIISNPYPSAVDFDALATANSGVVLNKYWMWDPSTGNYITRAAGSGSQQYIQVGQAFFVETTSAGTFNFTNSERAHSNDSFRDVLPNMLTMKVSGGNNGYKDRLTIRFDENATSGYDEEIEAVKWNSMYEDATMIRSIAEDGTELAINVLPLEGLQGDMVSVPVHFNCGYTADYTFDFEGIDSFEAGNEVWLEDKKNNDHWFYLNDNPHYTFTASSYGDPDRFVIHFFGPTSINEKDEAKVDIFSEGQYAYIKNVTNEKIKKVSVYNIAGSLVTSRTIPDGQKLSKIWVSDHMAYYVVQVITDSKVYTNKILITK